MERVLVIDGENLLHRSYHAANKTFGQKKPNTYVSYFINTLKSYSLMFSPTKIVCTWDFRKSGMVNERKTFYENYKKGRVFNENVQEFADDIRDFLNSLGVVQIHPLSREGDDIMYWLCAMRFPNECVLISTDTDMYQLIVPELSGNVIYNPIKKITINENYLRTNYNVVDGRQFIIRKALKGDPADCIKGVGTREKKLTKNRLEAIVNAMGSDFNIERVMEKRLLDDNELGVFLTNLEVMCLDRVKEHADEIEYYEKQLEAGAKPDFEKFKELLAKHEFWTIHKQALTYFNAYTAPHGNPITVL